VSILTRPQELIQLRRECWLVCRYRFFFVFLIGADGPTRTSGVWMRITAVSRIAVRTVSGGETLTVLAFLALRIA
jgi:hypothetical protein